MDTHYFKNISNFFVAGINYKKSDASARGQFAINNLTNTQSIFDKASLFGLE
jgi:glutamyl-tRNA reductase